jgi:3-deoxy-D-manno-octulosonate 8-phosphate phosphatase (KDO 8-P phosphatase)
MSWKFYKMKDFGKIKAILMDVDGVLTDGSINYDSDGKEIKCFNVQDGLGIECAIKCGIQIYWISSRKSKAVLLRAKELKINKLYQDVKDKKTVVEKIIKENKLSSSEISYIGDDLVDISVMKLVGLPIAVANACPEVKKHATIVTQAKGGQGAVREAIELILKKQGCWEKIIKKFTL